MNDKDKKTIIASLTFVINGLDDGTEWFKSECIDLRNRLENLTKHNNDFKASAECNDCKNRSDGVPDCVIDGTCPEIKKWIIGY